MNTSKIRIAFILILLVIFIVYKAFRTEKSAFYFSKKFDIEFNETRAKKGILPINSNWKTTHSQSGDILEVTYRDNDSANSNHLKKTINISSGSFFWMPQIQEEMDFYKFNMDSSKLILLNTVFCHQYQNNEDPWGLSYYSIINNGIKETNKQVGKPQIDSIINSWKK